jgi:hypothetical protein
MYFQQAHSFNKLPGTDTDLGSKFNPYNETHTKLLQVGENLNATISSVMKIGNIAGPGRTALAHEAQVDSTY